MNNPDNMWTDRNQKLVYVTQWFDSKLSVYDRQTGAFIRNVSVGEAPAHVMTRTDTDELHVTLNGDEDTDSVVELAPLAKGVERRVEIGRGNPHAHWMSHDGKKMATPNVFTGDTTQFDFPSDRKVSECQLAEENVEAIWKETKRGAKFLRVLLLVQDGRA